MGGGNKARKIKYIIADAKKQGANALITTGGVQSNHARVVALTAARLGMKCFLVLHGDANDYRSHLGNYPLMRMSGAQIKIVSPEKIAESIKASEEQCRNEGLIPYTIQGGGHTIHGATAYLDAMLEVAKQCKEFGYPPDWIILPSGTGTTQAGIVAGIQKLGWETRVVGISVARKMELGKEAVIESYKALCNETDIDFKVSSVDFRDSWVGEGYEKADARVMNTIKWASLNHGIILDPTYTGKAFLAMMDLIESGEISSNSKVLFWHTGGLLNLLSSKEFLDGLFQ